MSLVERAKAYNSQLKQIESEMSSTKAHVSYCEADLKKLCEEISQILGIEVNEDNVEEICYAQLEKIKNDLDAGEQAIKAIQDNTFTQEELEETIELETPIEVEDEFESFSRTRQVERVEEEEDDLASTLSSLGGLGSIGLSNRASVDTSRDKEESNLGNRLPQSRILDI